MTLGLMVFGFTLMSMTSISENSMYYFGRYPLITGTCDSGYEYEYYDIGYSQADHDDIVSAICNDPNNTSPISQ